MLRGHGIPIAFHASRRPNPIRGVLTMELSLGIPLTLGLGLGALALMALFVEACDRV